MNNNHYFQDAFFKEYSNHACEDKLHSVLKRSYRVFQDYKANPVVSIPFLEAIAGIRFAIMETANLLHSQIDEDNFDPLQLDLLELAEEVCTDPVINTTDFNISGVDCVDCVGPGIYLLKLLVRQYGFMCLKEVSVRHPWVIPEGLHTNEVSLPSQIAKHHCNIFE